MKIFILLAYPYFDKLAFKQLNEMPKKDYELWIDSGAFTVHKTGKKITLDQYHNFLDKTKDFNIKAKVQLDVIGDEKKTWENFLESKRQGFDVKPVFTRGSKFKSLDKMYDYDDYVFIGGIHGTNRDNFVKKVLLYNKGRKSHLLGYCNYNFVKHFKPYSYDVSDVGSCGIWGKIDIYLGGGKIVSIHKKDFSNGIPKKLIKYFSMLQIPEEQLRWLGKSSAWVNKSRFEFLQGGKDIGGFPYYLSTMCWLLRQYDFYKYTKTRLVFAVNAVWIKKILDAKNHLIKVGLIKEDS